MCMFEFQRESERVWKRQEREQQSPSWRRLTCSCRACTECAVYMCGCVCICVFVRKMMQTSSSSSHLPKQSDWSLHIGAALQHFEVYSLTHTDCRWLATKRHHNSEIKKTREEAAVSSPCWSNQDKSLTKQPEMMLVGISVWINRHGSVIKCPLVILYICADGSHHHNHWIWNSGAAWSFHGVGTKQQCGHYLESLWLCGHFRGCSYCAVLAICITLPPHPPARQLLTPSSPPLFTH